MRAVVVERADIRGRAVPKVAFSLREDVSHIPEGRRAVRAD